MNKYFGISLLLLFVLFSCREKTQRLPSSSNRPYEVTIVDDENDSLKSALSADVAGLPQPEPLFDVHSIERKEFRGMERYARAIVFFDRSDSMTIDKNIYSQPQIVIHAAPRDSNRIISALQLFEVNAQIMILKKKHNTAVEAYIKNMFGVNILIPADMTSSKKAKNFFWISNNAATGMKNIVVMNGNVNELLKKNLKGETDSMFVQLLDNGLWIMKGDAMGGPYRLIKLKSSLKNRDVSCLVFVYAPETNKRNLIRQMEAVLNTTKLYNYGRK